MTYPRWRFKRGLFALLTVALLLAATLYVNAQEPLLIAPSSGAPGTLHLIFAENLEPNTTYQLQIQGAESPILTEDVTSDSGGSISYNFTSDTAAPPGEYTVTLSLDGEVARSGTLTIEGEDASGAQTESLLIAPNSGPPGTLHLIFAENLDPSTRYQLVIINAETDAGLLSDSVTSDSTGTLSYNFSTQPGTSPGVYEVSLLTSTQIVRAGTLTIEGDETATEEPTAGAPTLTPTATGTPTSESTPTTEVQDGEIARNTPVQAELTEGTDGDEYTFAGTAGEVVVIRMESADFDAYLLLLDEQGNIIMRNDNGAGNFNAEISAFTLPADGTYTIVATSRSNVEENNASTTGAYTLTVSSAIESASGEILSGQTIVGTLNAGDSIPQYTFTVEAGATVTIDLASDDFDPALVLVSPDGNQIATDDDSGPSLYARLERVVLADAGVYTIVVDGFRGATGERVIEGDYRLTLRIDGEETEVFQPTAVPTDEVEPTEEAQPTDEIEPTDESTPEGEEAAQAIAYGETVEDELTDEIQIGVYTFEGSAGDVVTIALNSDDFDPLVILRDSSGNELARDDDGGAGVYSLIEGFELPADDTYTIEVDGYRGVNGDRTLSGTYTLTLTSGDASAQPTEEATEEAQPTDEVTPEDDVTPTPLPTLDGADTEMGVITAGESVTGTLNDTVQTAAYTFEVNAGDVVTIDLVSDDFDPFVILQDPNGTTIASDDDSGGNSQARIEAFTLPESGTYMIVVDAFRGFSGNQSVNGNYMLTLAVEAGSTTPTEIVPTGTPTPFEPTAVPTVEGMTPTPTFDVTAPPIETPVVTPAATTVPFLPPLNIDVMGAEAEAINLGEQVEVTFEGNAAEVYIYTFEANAGNTLSVFSFSDGTLDTILRLIAPDGTLIAVDDDSGSTNDPELQQVMLTQDGEYRLVVQPYISGARGTLTIYPVRIEPFVWDGEPLSYSVASKIKAYSPLVVEGVEGATMRLFVRRLDYDYSLGTPTITITQGETILAQNQVGIGAGLTIDFIVPADGDVFITFSYEGIGGTLMELALEEVE